MTPIGSVLKPRKEKVDRKKFAFADLQPITIHFDGSIDRREVDKGRSYAMELFFARSGDIVVAKIDLKNGAVGIVPEWENVVVTNHFAVYEPERTKLLPEYFHLLIQTSFFKAFLWRNKVGAEGRKEVKLEFFEKVEIPLPTLDIQHALVDHWEKAQVLVKVSNQALAEVVNDLNKKLYSLYRENTKTDVLKSSFLTLSWSDIQQWDVKSSRAAAFRNANANFHPLGEFVEEVTEFVRTWEEPEKEWAVYGVNNKEGVFFNQYRKGKEFRTGYAYKRIKKDWFFHNPTRSSVGSLGIVPEVPENAITSPEYQVWRIKSGLVPGFVAALINTPFFVELIQFHRVGAVKQRLYVDNLLEIRIPVFSETEQQRIADERDKALKDIEEATKNMQQVSKDVEALILGAKRL